MSVKKKPLVVVTRKLPDSIEIRMRELFDARLNLDDTPMTPEQIAARVAIDPSYAARLGNPVVEAGPRIGTNVYTYLTYPPLVNPTEMSVRLVETGEFLTVDRNGWACLAAVTPDTVVMVVEFHHAGLDHYFYSGDASEIADIDAGKVGAWMRTGKRFRVTREPGCRGATTDTVV